MTNAKAKLAGLALIAALCAGFTLGLTAPAWAGVDEGVVMADVLIGVPMAILIAAVSAWIAVQLSLRKFRSERWWERKADAYAKVIEALHNSKEFSDRHLARIIHGAP